MQQDCTFLCKNIVEVSLCTGKKSIHSLRSIVNSYADTISLRIGVEARLVAYTYTAILEVLLKFMHKTEILK